MARKKSAIMTRLYDGETVADVGLLTVRRGAQRKHKPCDLHA